jgi:hypothetical protein
MVGYGLSAHRSLFVSDTLSRINPHFLAPFGENAPHPEVGDLIDDLCEVGRAAE